MINEVYVIKVNHSFVVFVVKDELNKTEIKTLQIINLENFIQVDFIKNRCVD